MTLTDHTKDERPRTAPRAVSAKKVAAYAGVVLTVCGLVVLLLPGVFVNPFLEGRITGAFEEAYPAHTMRIDGLHYNVWTNRLRCDSVRITGADSMTVASASRISVAGIDRLPLLLGGGLTPAGIGGARAEAGEVVFAFANYQHEIRCDSLSVSAPDSSLTIIGLRYGPSAGDQGYFAGSAYRRTRYRFSAPLVSVAGLAWTTPGNGCRARALRTGDASLTVLINKEKPVNGGDAAPRMPAEMLASLGAEVEIDSVVIGNGRFTYQERFDAGADPAVLTLENIQVTATGVGNVAGRSDTVSIQARGILMGAGSMAVRMSIPVASPVLSFRYSGSLGEMDLSRLNPFLEVSEGIRIKTGVLHSADFDVDVYDGTAGGDFRAAYENLSIVAIDSRTGSEGDVVDTFISLVANNVRLRRTSMPDGPNPPEAGVVQYDHHEGETFLELSWFGLCTGISDVVGF